MPTYTTNYNLAKPNVNSADDEDLWGDQLNDNFDTLDTTLKSVSDQADKSSPATTTKTGNYTVVAADFGKTILVDATAGAVGITFPDPAVVGDGFKFSVKKVDSSANAVTNDGDGNTIDGESSKVLDAQYDTEHYVTNGTNWFVIADYNLDAALSGGVGLYQTTGTTITSSTAYETIDFDTEAYDDFGWHDNATNNSRITVDRDCRLLVNGHINFNINSNAEYWAAIAVNGTIVSRMGVEHGSNVNSLNKGTATITDIIELSSGDYVELMGYKSTASSITTATGETYGTTLRVQTL